MAASYQAHISFAIVLILQLVCIISQDGKVIGQGQCRSDIVYPRGNRILRCPIPRATPDMNLRLRLVSRLSRAQCQEGVNYGLASDNSYMWTSNGCGGAFEVVQVEDAKPDNVDKGGDTDSPDHSGGDGSNQDNNNKDSSTTSGNNPYCGRQVNNGFRIIGGTQADTCEFPWLAYLYNQVDSVSCTATILDRSHIMTAAHCVTTSNRRGQLRIVDAKNFIVFSGTAEVYIPYMGFNPAATRSSASKITPHPNYSATSLTNDIAVIKLREPLTYNNCHVPVCLPDPQTRLSDAGNCIAAGWGRTSNTGSGSGTLLYTDIEIKSSTTCWRTYRRPSNTGTFCAGGDNHSICNGDSGGPLACRQSSSGGYVQYGVTSAGIRNRCGSSPALFTDVRRYVTWIRERMQE